MCGIFGLIARTGAKLSRAQITSLLAELYCGSESRGKESAGWHAYLPEQRRAWTLKGAVPATTLLRSAEYRRFEREVLDLAAPTDKQAIAHPLAILGHSRLVTNGAAERSVNNQPVRWGGTTIIHNGIVVNVDDLWARHPHLLRTAEVDTEVLAALLTDSVRRSHSAAAATQEAFAALRGAASIVWAHDTGETVVLATNTGDLYYHLTPEGDALVFASERYILQQALAKVLPATVPEIHWLRPRHGVVVTIPTGQIEPFAFADGTLPATSATRTRPSAAHTDAAIEPPAPPQLIIRTADESLLRYNEQRVRSLRRCTRCVLPETFPFIAFDDEGCCNYCRSYRPRYRGKDPVATKRAFIDSLAHYRRNGASPDVIVAFSGGRDSSYGLHLIKNEFGLTPITFTYDWGMVTDLARRNIARICGQLGIQNILVSADIKQKRDNIRKNVAAWLKRPDLGLVPLFMAGDKHFFRVVNEIKRQTGIRLDLWSANPLENTDFKSGFCGVSPDFEKKRVDYLSFSRKARMAAYYGQQFLLNPSYLNSSLWDTAGAFFAYYIEPRRDFYFIFDHMVWEEKEVNRTLLSEYDWELAPDTRSTWRIGDGTAPFYNYIYMTARGFSEFDTFRSNQIREGQLTREEAMESVAVENRPRRESLQWYLSTIGLDFNTTIRRINELDTLNLHR